MIKITMEWKDKGKFENIIRYIENNLIYGEAQEKIRILAHHGADHMRNTISSSRKRPDKGSHKLENAITAETVNTTGGIEVGIGKIETLKREAPYYEMIDAGATYDTKKTFIPPPFEDGEFRTFKKGSSHIIQGINYVSKAIDYIDRELIEVMKKIGATFVEGLSKSSSSIFGGHSHGWGRGAGGAK